MNNFQVLGKFLDQPILVSKFQESVPKILAGSTVAYTSYNVIKAPEGKKKETGIQTGVTLAVAVASAVVAPKIASKIFSRPLIKNFESIKQDNTKLVDNFIKSNSVDNNTEQILTKSKNNILNMKDIKTLFNELSKNNAGKSFLEKLIPNPKNISAKDIFSEIGYLSVYGAIPVAGGIAGGIGADKINNIGKENGMWKKKIPDKIKEGVYQYLANIFLCNIGAGMALMMLERAKIHSKSARAVGMTLGIILTGIVGGSKIANFIGRKVVDPLCDKIPKQRKCNSSNILDNYCNKHVKKKDRTPELLDIGLHTDDIATVSLLSGLKWIEPALPCMYTVSGYRAGIGYRN